MLDSGRVRLFGGLRLETADARVITLNGRKEKELMAAIAIQQGESVSRERLACDLWEADDFSSRRSLNTALWRLRKSISAVGVDCDDWFETGTDFIRLRRKRGPVVDVVVMQEDISRFRQGHIEAAQAAQSLSTLSGALLPNITADWISNRRHSVEHEIINASVDVADALIKKEPNWAIELTNAVIKVDPYEERAWRALMSAYMFSGRQALAHATYSKLVALLSDDLGVEPSVETKALLRPDSGTIHTVKTTTRRSKASNILSDRLETLSNALSLVLQELEDIRQDLENT